MTLGVVGSQYLYKYEKEIWQTFDYDGGYSRLWREWEAIPAVTFIRKHFINKSFPNQHCQAWSSCNITKAIIRDRFYFVQMLKQTQAVYAPLPHNQTTTHALIFYHHYYKKKYNSINKNCPDVAEDQISSQKKSISLL